MRPFGVADGNVAKELNATGVRRCLTRLVTANVAVFLGQEFERAHHVRILEEWPGLDTYWPSGKAEVRAKNACPIAWRSARFEFVTGGAEQLSKGVAHLAPARFATWAALRDRETGEIVPFIATHLQQGIRKKGLIAAWGRITRLTMNLRQIRKVRALTKRLEAEYGCVVGGMDGNHHRKLAGKILGARIYYAARPTKGKAFDDFLWSRGAVRITGVHRVTDPSDHDGLVGTVRAIGSKPKPHPQPKPQEAPVARIDGIDISHWQNGRMDFAKARRAGVKFVCHKATESTTYVDGNHGRRMREVDNAGGIAFGSYHFARPGRSSGAAQAEFFLKHAAIGKGRMRPMLDLEDRGGLNQTQLTRWVGDWVRVVSKATGGVPPIIYTNFSLDDHFDCMRWAARYSNAMSLPHAAHPWAAWAIWQFSNGAYGKPRSVPGIGRCDINTFNSGIDIDVITLGAAKQPKHVSRLKEDDMPSPADLWNFPIDNVTAEGKSQGTMTAAAFLRNIERDQDALRHQVADLTALVKQLIEKES